MQQQNVSIVDWIKESLESFGDPTHLSLTWQTLDEILEEAKEMEANNNNWKLVDEEMPPSDVELLVKSPSGIVHLSSWRQSYNIFTCQDKRESSLGWKWKLI